MTLGLHKQVRNLLVRSPYNLISIKCFQHVKRSNKLCNALSFSCPGRRFLFARSLLMFESELLSDERLESSLKECLCRFIMTINLMKKDFSAINDAVNDVQLNCCPRCKLIFQCASQEHVEMGKYNFYLDYCHWKL